MIAFLAAALALSVPGDARLLGWTDDGRYLVFTGTEATGSTHKTYYLPKGDDRVEIENPDKLSAADRARLVAEEDDMDGQEDERAWLATVTDVRTGEAQRYLLKYAALSFEGRTKGELKKKVAALPDGRAFEAWKKGRTFVKGPGRGGPHGCKADVAVAIEHRSEDGDDGDAQAPPRWKRDRISWTVSYQAKVTLASVCGPDRSTEIVEQGMAAQYVPEWSATPYWDPTGRRVLFVFEEAVTNTMRGPDGGHLEYHVVTAGPRVELLAPDGLAAATGKVADAVEAAGFAVVATGTAKQERAATVVYADDAHAAIAAKIAAAIPGGATVDKLTWKPKADVVVAIGASAR